MFGRSVGDGGLGFGVDRDEQAPAIRRTVDANSTSVVTGAYIFRKEAVKQGGLVLRVRPMPSPINIVFHKIYIHKPVCTKTSQTSASLSEHQHENHVENSATIESIVMTVLVRRLLADEVHAGRRTRNAATTAGKARAAAATHGVISGGERLTALALPEKPALVRGSSYRERDRAHRRVPPLSMETGHSVKHGRFKSTREMPVHYNARTHIYICIHKTEKNSVAEAPN